MKKIKIILPRYEYIPGDVIKGKVVLNCDERFRCKSASVKTIQKTEIRYFEDDYKGRVSLKEKSYILYEAQSVFAENTDFNEGEHEFPFNFQLPDDLKPTYFSGTLSIFCYIDASMRESRMKKLRTGTKFNILHPITEYADEVIEESSPDSPDNSLQIRMDSQKHNIGDDIVFYYFVNTDTKFKLLRAEIEHIEQSEQVKSKTSNILLKAEISSDKITRHEWNKCILGMNHRLNVSYSFHNFQSILNLKVSIVRNFKSNITARIPLIVGHDLKPGWREKQETWKARKTKRIAPSDERISDDERTRSAQFWYNRAITFMDKGEIEKAMQSVHSAIKWQPDFTEALALKDELKKRQE
ncbi:MAG: hypothetical protein RTV72_13355 [Candidatus Thorarchaeota archaeon]